MLIVEQFVFIGLVGMMVVLIGLVIGYCLYLVQFQLWGCVEIVVLFEFEFVVEFGGCDDYCCLMDLFMYCFEFFGVECCLVVVLVVFVFFVFLYEEQFCVVWCVIDVFELFGEFFFCVCQLICVELWMCGDFFWCGDGLFGFEVDDDDGFVGFLFDLVDGFVYYDCGFG